MTTNKDLIFFIWDCELTGLEALVREENSEPNPNFEKIRRMEERVLILKELIGLYS